MTSQQPIPEAFTSLLALFASDLAHVRFGDLDRAALETAAAAVQAAAAELATAELAAAAARAELEATRDELLQTGQRALAYARIYAEGSPPLTQRLQTISFASGPRPGDASDANKTGAAETITRRRGRPAKTSNEATGRLPLEAPDGQPPEMVSAPPTQAPALSA